MTIPTKDLMTRKLITLSVGATLAEAAELMKENGVRHLPIIDDSDGIIGILSSKDFPTYGEYSDLNVEFFMSSPVMYIHQDTPLRLAIQKMLESKVSSLLISDEKEDAVGIITTEDLLWYLLHNMEKADKEAKAPFFSVMDAQTLGQVAHQISLAGI